MTPHCPRDDDRRRRAGRGGGRPNPPPRAATGPAAPPRGPPPRRGGSALLPRDGQSVRSCSGSVFLVAVPSWAWTRSRRSTLSPTGRTRRPARDDVPPGGQRLPTTCQEERQDSARDVGQRTDTILLLHTGGGPNLLMSIPRGLGRGRSRARDTKLNAAFAFGGPSCCSQTQYETDIRIDHYVEIGSPGSSTSWTPSAVSRSARPRR